MPSLERWYVYVVRCGDNTFYTGISTNVARRLECHRQGRGARYTRGRGPLTLWWQSPPLSHQGALKWEAAIKSLSHQAKEARAFDRRG